MADQVTECRQEQTEESKSPGESEVEKQPFQVHCETCRMLATTVCYELLCDWIWEEGKRGEGGKGGSMERGG